MIKLAVVGYGYWGPNLVRNICDCARADLAAVCDASPERLAVAAGRYPAARMSTSFADVLSDPQVDAVAIATPVSTHFELAMAALKAGKHVLLEKPMTRTVAEAVQLVETADRLGLTLLTDHTFIYTEAVRAMRDLIVRGEVGDIYYYDSIRVNLGLFQHDVNVIWDLAVHDFSILDYILDDKPCAVSVTGLSHIPGSPENVAYASLFFDNNTIAHVNVNWLAPVKIRQTLVGGSKKMILYNDLEQSEKLKVYDKGVTQVEASDDIYQLMVNYRSGDMWSPALPANEALSTEIAHFVDCIETGSTPITDGQMGLRVVEMLEGATVSMHEKGRPVELKRHFS
jgi:predicted dehydrogenase